MLHYLIDSRTYYRVEYKRMMGPTLDGIIDQLQCYRLGGIHFLLMSLRVFKIDHASLRRPRK